MAVAHHLELPVDYHPSPEVEAIWDTYHELSEFDQVTLRKYLRIKRYCHRCNTTERDTP